MSIQTQFTNEYIDRLPRIKAIISQESSKNIRSNMIEHVLTMGLLSEISIDDMSLRQVESFQDHIIDAFRFRAWIECPINCDLDPAYHQCKAG